MNFQFHPILSILINSCPGFILVLAPVWTCDFPVSSNPHFGPMWKRFFHFPKEKSKDQLAQSTAKEILGPSVWLQFFFLFLLPAACWPESHIPEFSGNPEASQRAGGQGPAGSKGRRADSSESDVPVSPRTHVPSETTAFITTSGHPQKNNASHVCRGGTRGTIKGDHVRDQGKISTGWTRKQTNRGIGLQPRAENAKIL